MVTKYPNRVHRHRIAKLLSNLHIKGMSISVIMVDPAATDVFCTDDTLQVTLSDGRIISVPLTWPPRLCSVTPTQRKNWRLIAGGVGIHWEEIDEDISVRSLLRLS